MFAVSFGAGFSASGWHGNTTTSNKHVHQDMTIEFDDASVANSVIHIIHMSPT